MARPGPLRNLIASTTLAVANTTTTFAPNGPNDDLGTATGTGFWQPEYRGARFWVNISAISGTSATATFTVKKWNPRVGAIGSSIIASAAFATTGLNVLDVYPGITTGANLSVSAAMGNYVIQVLVSNTTTPSVTFTVDVEYIP